MKIMIRSAVAIAALAVSVQAFPANAQEAFIGEIREFPYNFCPRGWTDAKGQLLPIAQNQSLYSLLGTTYGGDGRTTFALPDYSTTVQSAPVSTPVASEVTIYQHCNYAGWSVALAAGSYSAGDMGASFIDNDASSIKVPAGASATLYDGTGLEGASMTVTEDNSCFVDAGFNDVLSSLSIEAPEASPAPEPEPVASGPKVRTCIALVGIYPSRN